MSSGERNEVIRYENSQEADWEGTLLETGKD